MLVATIAFSEAATIAPLDSGDSFVVWDTVAGTEEWLPHPAANLTVGRRLAVVDEMSAHRVDVACATPASFCTTSYAVAQALGLQFLPLETGTRLPLLRAALPALAAARPDLAVSWLTAPARVPTPPATADGIGALSPPTTRAVLNRLKRLEGQSSGVQRLIEERHGYDEILPQLAAMRSALEAIGLTLLAERLADCLAAGDSPEGSRRVEEAKRAFLKLHCRFRYYGRTHAPRTIGKRRATRAAGARVAHPPRVLDALRTRRTRRRRCGEFDRFAPRE